MLEMKQEFMLGILGDGCQLLGWLKKAWMQPSTLGYKETNFLHPGESSRSPLHP